MNKLTEDVLDRRYRMFLFGANGKEIALCFNKTKPRLVMAGAKPSKVAGQYIEQVRFMSRLKGKHRDIICTWFKENCHFDDLPSADDVLRQYSSLEDVAVLQKEEASRFWRTLLHEYIQSAPSPMVEAFLEGAIMPDAGPSEVVDEVLLSMTASDVDGALVVAKGDCDEVHPDQPFPAFMLGVAGIIRADAGLVAKGREALSNEGAIAGKVLLPILNALAAGSGPGAGPGREAGTKVAAKLASVILGDPVDYAVLGYRTTVTQAGVSFFRIAGLLHDETLVDLGPDDVVHMFPSNGDAIAYPKNIAGYPHDYDGLSVWRVEHGRADMSAQFVVSKWLHQVYEIVSVPHSSTEPNRVREWLLEGYRPDPNIYPLFQLEDGMFVKMATGIRDPRQVDFDVPLQAYESLPAVLWRGRKLVVEPLPAPKLKLDCSPPSTLVKRLFKHRAQIDGLAGITRAQVQQLADLFASEAGAGAIAARKQDLADLASLVESREALDWAISGVLKLPAVQQGIAEEKARAVEATKAQRKAEEDAIDDLRSARRVLEQEIQQAKEAQKKQAGELASEVRKAFDRASADASKTLSEVAVFKAFLGQTGEARVAPEARPPKTATTHGVATGVVLTGKQLGSVKDLNVAITRHCIVSGLGQGFAKAMVAAAASQSVVALDGSRTRQVAAMLSSIIGGGVGCRVAVTADLFGVHDLLNAPAIVSGSAVRSMRLGDFISAQQVAGNPAVIHLNGANRAPLESYLPELLAAAPGHGRAGALAWLGRDGEPRLVEVSAPLVFVLDFASGKSTFPLVAPLAWEVPVFDTDATWFDSDAPDPGHVAPHVHVEAGFWESLRRQDATLPAQLASALAPVGTDAASRMASACRVLDMEAVDASLLGFAVYAVGRAGEDAAAQALASWQSPLASDVARYLAARGRRYLDCIFDLDEGIAR